MGLIRVWRCEPISSSYSMMYRYVKLCRHLGKQREWFSVCFIPLVIYQFDKPRCCADSTARVFRNICCRVHSPSRCTVTIALAQQSGLSRLSSNSLLKNGYLPFEIHGDVSMTQCAGTELAIVMHVHIWLRRVAGSLISTSAELSSSAVKIRS